MGMSEVRDKTSAETNILHSSNYLMVGTLGKSPIELLTKPL
jgi:hypothetical protein